MKNSRKIALLKKIKAKNIKITSQRNYIIDLFLENNHWTLKQILTKSKNDGIKLNVATLYNTISIFLKNNIIVSYSFEKTEHIYELEDKMAFHVWFEHEDDEKNYFIEVQPSENLYENILSEAKKVMNKKYDPRHIKIEIHMQKK